MYQVKYSDKAAKQLSKLDKGTARVILTWIKKNLQGCDNPRLKGKSLTANHKGQWRYRVGAYRLICEIQDEEITILVLAIGHRRNIYLS